MKRVVLTGAECTGKTTLAKALADHYGEPWSDEYVRHYVNQLDRPLERADLEPIARGQLALEDSAAERAKRFVLHDTDLFSSILYAKHYFGAQIDWVDEAFRQRRDGLYLLCTPEGIDWEADPGQREGPAARATLHRIFKRELNKQNLPHTELTGSVEERFRAAVAAIDRFLSPPE
ncbi:MAG: AAA family ATPase [Opitutales bacterium]